MRKILKPEFVVQHQLDAYNAHDLEEWLSTYAADACQYAYPDTLLANGIEAIRERARSRFAEPNLHAHLRQRIVMGNMVIDHEEVVRDFPNEGSGRIELMAIYLVVESKIKSASFAFGKKIIDTV